MVSGALAVLGFLKAQWKVLAICGAIIAGAAVIHVIVGKIEAAAKYEAAAQRLGDQNAALADALDDKEAELANALQTIEEAEAQKREIASEAAALRRFIDTTQEEDNAPAAPVLTGVLDRLGGNAGGLRDASGQDSQR